MTEGLYECHVTVRKPTDAVTREQCVSIAKRLHWKTSEIERDPLLGDDTYFYFTSHGTAYDTLFERMVELRKTLQSPGIDIEVVREKVESIVYDVRYA